MNYLFISGCVILFITILTFFFPGLVLSKKQKEVIEMRGQDPKQFALLGRLSGFVLCAVAFALGAALELRPELKTLWYILDDVAWIGFFVAAFVRNKVYLGRFVGVW